MKNSARGELVEPCELRVSVAELFSFISFLVAASPYWAVIADLFHPNEVHVKAFISA